MRPPVGALLWRSQRVYQVFAANTDVGKTIFTTLLCKAARRRWKDGPVAYLKPVSTGPISESDESCNHLKHFAPDVAAATLVQYQAPVSPHLAAIMAGKSGQPSDSNLLAQCREHASKLAAQCNSWLFIETAGGVHSPAPSKTTQAELYKPLRAPIVLVGDSRLGGISQTISAYESLRIRGYDIDSVLLFEDNQFHNHRYLQEYFLPQHDTVRVSSVAGPPARQDDQQADRAAMAEYYEQTSGEETMQDVIQDLDERHKDRISALESMADKAHRTIWYPFTQQSLLTPEKITVIDSAHDDYFQTLRPAAARQQSSPSPESQSLLQPSFDASASWWTQGLGHASSRLTLAAAYAAGRYGHVMFAEAIHKPALELAETILRHVGNPRVTRVFYSDNGSTGMEVAVKMALRAARLRYYGDDEAKAGPKLEILGLKGAYHGDTLAAMDCAEPCAFNETTEWYEGKGFWFDVPSVLCTNGQWRVSVPGDLLGEHSPQEKVWERLNNVFDLDKRIQRGEDKAYRHLIRGNLERLQKQGRRFGALLLEPVVLGAGGMVLVDPLFQRVLVEVVRESTDLLCGDSYSLRSQSPGHSTHDWQGLPVVFDEVFTGLYRLGPSTSSAFLDVRPDISVHAKLLTGGLLPLCTTLASESIFNAFGGSQKTSALLHGHSYTAHAVGCQVAVESLNEMREQMNKGHWDSATKDWVDGEGDQTSKTQVWSNWPHDVVKSLSANTQQVEGVWALGSVLAIHLKDASGVAGYGSNAAVALRDRLAQGSSVDGPWNVHARVLGNVLYLMTGQTTKKEEVQRVSELLLKSL